MFLHVDPDNGLAIYDQIVRQIKFAVATRALPPGEMAPSVRELARELAVNLNTVSKAYRQLQVEGVLESVRGMGLAVSSGAVKQCRAERIKLVQERLREVLWGSSAERHRRGRLAQADRRRDAAHRKETGREVEGEVIWSAAT